MRFYSKADKIIGNEPGIRCFTSLTDAENSAEGDRVFEFDAEISAVVVREGAFEKNFPKTFIQSEIPATKYTFGSFLAPVFFVAKDVFDGNAREFSGDAEELKLFERSDRFYVECLFEKLKEEFPNFELYAVRSCLEALVKAGKMKRTENNECVFYEDLSTGNTIPVCKRYIK